MKDLEPFIIENKGSIWLCMAILIVSAVMHQPSFASMLALVFEAGLLAALRWCAHVEGRSQR